MSWKLIIQLRLETLYLLWNLIHMWIFDSPDFAYFRKDRHFNNLGNSQQTLWKKESHITWYSAVSFDNITMHINKENEKQYIHNIHKNNFITLKCSQHIHISLALADSFSITYSIPTGQCTLHLGHSNSFNLTQYDT